MPDKPEEHKQDLEGWFIGGEQAQTEELVTTPPGPDPPPVVPDAAPGPEPKPSNWARSAVLTAAMLAFGGAGIYHFYPNLVRRSEPIPVAPEPQPKPPEPPIPRTEPAPEPKIEQPPPAIKAEPKPLPKPEPKKKVIVPPIQRVEAPPAKPEPVRLPAPKVEPPVAVVPDSGPKPPVRTRLTRPDVNTIVAPPPAVYRGPSSGIINWSGRLEKNGTVAIEGATAESGTVNGALPGVPVMIEIESKDFGIAEAPSPNNGWRRLVIRSRRKVHSVVTIRWTLVQQQ